MQLHLAQIPELGDRVPETTVLRSTPREVEVLITLPAVTGRAAGADDGESMPAAEAPAMGQTFIPSVAVAVEFPVAGD